MSKAIEYFRTTGGFERVLSAMFDIYHQNGRVFGAVRLTHPNEDEEAALSSFFKRDYYNQALIRIGLADFERQIQKNFPEAEDFNLGDFLVKYMGTSKRQDKSAFVSMIVTEILPKYNGIAAEWLKEITRQTRREYRKWAEKYKTETETVVQTLQNVCNALDSLPIGNLVPVSVFSEKFTSSPYAFDFYNDQGKLFLKALAFLFKQPAPTNTEDCIKLHLRAGLLTCGKISSVTIHQAETKIFTLENLSKNDITPPSKIYVFEEPLIFNAVCERVKNCTIIKGDNSAAFVHLLKMFSDIPVYYAGNMTYRSLEIADKLYLEFGKNFIPWRYSREDYEYILSHETLILAAEKKHLSLHNEELASLLSLLKKTGKTASSMPLLPFYIKDMEE